MSHSPLWLAKSCHGLPRAPCDAQQWLARGQRSPCRYFHRYYFQVFFAGIFHRYYFQVFPHLPMSVFAFCKQSSFHEQKCALVASNVSEKHANLQFFLSLCQKFFKLHHCTVDYTWITICVIFFSSWFLHCPLFSQGTRSRATGSIRGGRQRKHDLDIVSIVWQNPFLLSIMTTEPNPIVTFHWPKVGSSYSTFPRHSSPAKKSTVKIFKTKSTLFMFFF